MGWVAGIGLALSAISTGLSVDQGQKSHLADEEAKKVAAKNEANQQDLIKKNAAQKQADQQSLTTADALDSQKRKQATAATGGRYSGYNGGGGTDTLLGGSPPATSGSRTLLGQ